MKGSWLLRKAWKIYQRTYTQLYEMYAERFGSDGTQQPRMYDAPIKNLRYLRLFGESVHLLIAITLSLVFLSFHFSNICM